MGLFDSIFKKKSAQKQAPQASQPAPARKPAPAAKPAAEEAKREITNMIVKDILDGKWAHANFGPCLIHLLTTSDAGFISQLTGNADVRSSLGRFLGIEGSPSDIMFERLTDMYSHGEGFSFRIDTKEGQPAGIFSVKFRREGGKVTGDLYVGIMPSLRGRKCAVAPVTVMSGLLTGSYLDSLNADLSLTVDKRTMASILDNAGYSANPGSEVWSVSLSSNRMVYFREAQHCASRKDYRGAIEAYNKALKSPATGHQISDAQIYSNIGMSYSELEQYATAYKCLKKAESLGLHNPQITQELGWLESHRHLW